MTIDEAQAEIDRLQIENASIKSAQQGSDRRVTLLTEELEKIKPTEAPPPATVSNQITEREKLLDRKERVLILAMEKGINPQEAFSLLGLDGDRDDETRLGDYQTQVEGIKQTERKAIAKENGKNPYKNVTLSFDVPPIEKLLKMSPEKIRTYPTEKITEVVDEFEGKKPSLRDRIARRLGR